MPIIIWTLRAIPLVGSEVDKFMCQILDKFPPTMKVAERTKAGKEALWKAFHIKDRKFPRWAQEADCLWARIRPWSILVSAGTENW